MVAFYTFADIRKVKVQQDRNFCCSAPRTPLLINLLIRNTQFQRIESAKC